MLALFICTAWKESNFVSVIARNIFDSDSSKFDTNLSYTNYTIPNYWFSQFNHDLDFKKCQMSFA